MRLIVRLLVAAGLGVDAYIHIDLASQLDGVRNGGGISEGWLFRIQASIAVLAAVLILIRSHRLAYVVTFLVAGSALGAVLLYRYVDVGSIGPLPNMYEPIWYMEKNVTAIAEGVATAASLVGLLITPGWPRRSAVVSRQGA